MSLKIKKGDTVKVLRGKDRGKTGRVVNVYPEVRRVMVEGVNIVKRHEPIRPAQGRQGTTGGIIQKEMPVDISNVALVCPSCSEPTRVGYEIGADGKERMCKRCGVKL
jgi:large subunit ribosomal protein L24